jgi:transcriptional regulator with XRE-family HTH domain
MKKSLGETIKLLRVANRISATDLADKISVKKSYVSLIESDTRRPSVDVLKEIATALNVPLSFLVEVSTGEASEKRNQPLKDVFQEFDEVERKLRNVIAKLSGSSKTKKSR